MATGYNVNLNTPSYSGIFDASSGDADGSAAFEGVTNSPAMEAARVEAAAATGAAVTQEQMKEVSETLKQEGIDLPVEENAAARENDRSTETTNTTSMNATTGDQGQDIGLNPEELALNVEQSRDIAEEATQDEPEQDVPEEAPEEAGAAISEPKIEPSGRGDPGTIEVTAEREPLPDDVVDKINEMAQRAGLEVMLETGNLDLALKTQRDTREYMMGLPKDGVEQELNIAGTTNKVHDRIDIVTATNHFHEQHEVQSGEGTVLGADHGEKDSTESGLFGNGVATYNTLTSYGDKYGNSEKDKAATAEAEPEEDMFAALMEEEDMVIECDDESHHDHNNIEVPSTPIRGGRALAGALSKMF